MERNNRVMNRRSPAGMPCKPAVLGFPLVCLLLCLGMLQGCFNAGDATTATSGGTSTGGSSNASTSGSDPTDATQQVSIGRIENGTFHAGQLAIGLDTVAAGGSSGVSATLVDGNGNPLTDSYDVTFNSQCIASGLAEITSPVSTINGVASTTYVARGCTGTDTITARVTVNQQELNAQGSLTVEAAELGSIEFVSASPQTIALKGMGGKDLTHSSTVVFRVLNAVGGPVANANVDFSLSTAVGGIEIQPNSGVTDANGYVQTVVQAGNVHTSVRVNAVVQNTGISSQSSQLIISTGVPDQDSMSLSFSVHNPEAWSYDGVEVDVTVHASDRYNNPVPDGTTVSFYTELGQIQPDCKTENGACVVKWVSSNPREDLGRSIVVAAAIGEETFIDFNGNGIFDDGDSIKTDIGEVYEDWNENGVYDAGEPFLDFNVNGTRDGSDGLYTGLGCADSTRCATPELRHVSASAPLVMAESSLAITDDVGRVINLPYKGQQAFNIQVGGLQWGQVPPAETTITAESDVGELKGMTSYTMPSSNGSAPITLPMVVIGAGETDGKTGVIKITATTPRGIQNTHLISITEDAP